MVTEAEPFKRFMMLFQRLRDWSEDDPVGLAEFAKADASIRDLIKEVVESANSIKDKQQRSRDAFSQNTNPQFHENLREYEQRFENVCQHIWVESMLWELGIDSATPLPSDDPDRRWSRHNREAHDQTIGLENAIAFAQENIVQDRWEDLPDLVEEIENGVAAWKQLKDATGMDLQGMFRRRELIPFVLVPKRISDRSSLNPMLWENLRQAHLAFVFGATHAALALMRATVEAVLRDHYKAQGEDLAQRIDNAYKSRILPAGAQKKQLHRLRRLGGVDKLAHPQTD